MQARSDLLSRWIAALRSGAYPQCFGRLKRSKNSYFGIHKDQFCAIGVLQELLPDEHTAKNIDDAGSMAVAALHMPPAQSAHIVRMNDAARRSFSEIADWIEKNVQPT